jgi:hypothetical protein
MVSAHSCKLSPSQPYNYPWEPEPAPENTLPANKIMRLQGIASIHCIICDSSIVNGHTENASVAKTEYYIDQSRLKKIQYVAGNSGRNITVYDIGKKLSWESTSGKAANINTDIEYIKNAYNHEIRQILGSQLEEPLQYVGKENMGSILCDVFEDKSGFQEWVWHNYLLPVQYKRAWNYDNLCKRTFLQMRNIDLNQKFPDSIFDKPQ